MLIILYRVIYTVTKEKESTKEEVLTMWNEGTIEITEKDGEKKTVEYCIKHFGEPSEDYGIKGGKISKLSLKMDGEWIALYDRGWDLKPTSKAAERAFKILVKKYN